MVFQQGRNNNLGFGESFFRLARRHYPAGTKRLLVIRHLPFIPANPRNHVLRHIFQELLSVCLLLFTEESHVGNQRLESVYQVIRHKVLTFDCNRTRFIHIGRNKGIILRYFCYCNIHFVISCTYIR